MKIICAFFSLFLFSCINYSVEETTTCSNAKPAFKCVRYGQCNTVMAICETEIECRKICLNLGGKL